ncbi:hypothetical protein [Mycobacteroides franklinii]|uniref:hypothetical protein n=1 Tax=Mycobacteroides franklinii TaxID=948102 RepID=UPI0019D4FF61|nr:hypothetical protein [Mycobacteroides franklinii]
MGSTTGRVVPGSDGRCCRDIAEPSATSAPIGEIEHHARGFGGRLSSSAPLVASAVGANSPTVAGSVIATISASGDSRGMS